MKIIPKLTLALVAGTCAILAVNGWLRVKRERAFFEADRIRDHEMMGRSLAAAAAAVWRSDGQRAAIDAIDAVSRHFATVRIRWLPAGSAPRPDVDAALLRATPAGEPVTVAPSGAGDRGMWTTYVPLDVEGVRRGSVELSEPPSTEQRFVRTTVADTVAMTAALAIVSALLAFVMGQWLVGAPVRLLSEKARRIGRGDFGGPVTLRQRDELAELAAEMNAMCDRLVATLDQLRHADRLATVGKLASGVAHELGTPLNVVSARARMISAGETDEAESREYARIIEGATDRMTKIIRQLLQFARRGRTEQAPHDLRKLARDAIELLRPLAQKTRAELRLAAGDSDATASVDAAQMQQVLTNLLMNAIQAMPDGGVVEVDVARVRAEPPPELGRPGGEHLCLRVRDDGRGIAPEHLSHVFEPFFTTKDVGAGTGLGLAVAYGIVRDHGGWIDVESRPGAGATFRVYLPA